jgi:hypothetical protein
VHDLHARLAGAHLPLEVRERGVEVLDHVLGGAVQARGHARVDRDRSTPLASRHGAAFVLALRPWVYSGFAPFLRRRGP